MRDNRREFIQKGILGVAGLSLMPHAFGYSSIMGSNERLRVAVAGVRSRGEALLSALMQMENVEIACLIDVDTRVLEEKTAWVSSVTGRKVKGVKDFRKALEDKSLDAVFIATPDHTHTPFAIRALEAGKHVYVEKPLSHNLAEGIALVEAAKKSGLHVQVGNQQRSAPTTIEAAEEIRGGLIGEVLAGRSWYSNTRGSIGTGRQVPVPTWLDWELFQGPAPKQPYRDNIVHYNWHWFWQWGTGEVNNNGLHEIDICRYAMGLELPEKVHSKGGRYFYQDDWEFWDTQEVTFTYEADKTITWEGHSCNGLKQYGRDRGSLIMGTKGSVFLTRNGVEYYDAAGKVQKSTAEKTPSATTDLKGAGALELYHIQNFINAIRHGETLHSSVSDINISNAMCHYGNLAQLVEKELEIDVASGKITNSEEAMKRWSRDYDPLW